MLTYSLAEFVQNKITLKNKDQKYIHVITTSLITILILFFIGYGIYAAGFYISTKYPVIISKVENILDQTAEFFPFLKNYLPQSPSAIIETIKEYGNQHLTNLLGWGQIGFNGVVHLLLGVILGIMLSVHQWKPLEWTGLQMALVRRFVLVYESFTKVVYSQVKISLINTVFTAIFLLTLKLFNIHIPYLNILILLTFIFGLIPVVGNIMSNSIIFIMGLGVSVWVAIIALVFLIVIHKLEYFINAKIIGTKIKAEIWEILAVLFIFQALIGIKGFILAPIFYAYFKAELRDAKIIN